MRHTLLLLGVALLALALVVSAAGDIHFTTIDISGTVYSPETSASVGLPMQVGPLSALGGASNLNPWGTILAYSASPGMPIVGDDLHLYGWGMYGAIDYLDIVGRTHIATGEWWIYYTPILDFPIENGTYIIKTSWPDGWEAPAKVTGKFWAMPGSTVQSPPWPNDNTDWSELGVGTFTGTFSTADVMSGVFYAAKDKLVLKSPSEYDVIFAKQGTEITIELHQEVLANAVVGYQAFLSYDATMLTYTGGALTNTPYDHPLLAPPATAAGEINLAAGCIGETFADAKLATLTFEAGSKEGITEIVFRQHDPETQFTDNGGDPVVPHLVDGPFIIVDNTLPTVIAPADINTYTDTDKCYATVTLGTPDTSDNYGVASEVNDAPAQFPVGETVVTWTVTDLAGNTATATQKVKVVDDQLPTITAPDDVSVNTDAGKNYASNVDLGEPVTSDNCGVESVVNNAPAQFPVGETIVTWTVTDIHGNIATATQKVTVTDNEAPYLFPPDDIAVDNDEGICGAALKTDPKGIWSLHGSVSIVDDAGENVLRLICGVDDADYSTVIFTCATPFKLEDLETLSASFKGVQGTIGAGAPRFTVKLTKDGDTKYLHIHWAEGPHFAYTPTGDWETTGNVIDATDARFELGPFGGPMYGTHAQALDFAGDWEVAAIYAVVDAPQQEFLVKDIQINEYLSARANVPIVRDNVKVVSVQGVRSDNGDLDGIYPVGETVITWTATDAEGNTTTATQKVTVTDAEAPKLTVPADITVNADPGENYATVDPGTATATDNCGVDSVVADGLIASGQYPIGTTTITWTATDIHGNTTTATQTITVNDKWAVEVEVELNGVKVDVSRDIEFAFGAAGTGAPQQVVTKSVAFTSDGTANSKGTVTFDIDAGQGCTKISAKDPKHTLRTLTDLTVVDGKYAATFTGQKALIGGDATGDNLIDILDFGVFAGQYNKAPSGPRDADFDCSGLVYLEDFTFITNNFLKFGDAEPGSIVAPSAGSRLQRGRTSITVLELSTIIGKREARNADLNGDGVVDIKDIGLFMASVPRR